jgi:hypothetical protein
MSRNPGPSSAAETGIVPVRCGDRLFDFARGGYFVRIGDLPRVMRPNRIAAGMQYTGNRSARRKHSDVAVTLMVRGTLDKLSTGLTYATMKGTCPTCGSRISKLKITSIGRRRLDELRRRASIRKAA